LRFFGDREKYAVSDPETNPEQTSKPTTTSKAITTSPVIG
jgi:hypothetical protein